MSIEDLTELSLSSLKDGASGKIIHFKNGDEMVKPVSPAASKASGKVESRIAFDRRELSEILRIYGRRVSDGEWRDYAMDFGKDRAVFSIFKRSSEMPLFQIEKNPKLARRQGAYSVTNAAGMVLKRGHDLTQVLKVFEAKRHLRVID